MGHFDPKETSRFKKACEGLAKVIAEHMPQEMLDAAIMEVAQNSLARFEIGSYELHQLITERIKERALELLKTKYADRIDILAEQAVGKGLESITGTAPDKYRKTQLG